MEKKVHADKFQEFKKVKYPQIELHIKHNTYLVWENCLYSVIF